MITSLPHKYRKPVKELVNLCAKGEYLNNFGFVFRDGTINGRYATGTICYGPMGRMEEPGKKIQYFVDSPGYLRSKERFIQECPEVIEYVDYVINRSAWSYPFVTKDPKFVWKNAAVLDTNWAIRYILQACILLRYTGENDKHHIIQSWLKLRSFVPNEDLALILSFFIQKQNKGSWVETTVPYTHAVFNANALKRIGLRRILNHKFHLQREHTKFEDFFLRDMEDRRWSDLISIWNDPMRYKIDRKSPILSFTENMKAIKAFNRIVYKSRWSDKEIPYLVDEFIKTNLPKKGEQND